MKVIVEVEPHELQSVVMDYVKEKFKHLAGKGEYLDMQRTSEPVRMTVVVEAKRETTSAWD